MSDDPPALTPLRECWQFIRQHWLHLAIAPVLAFTAITFLHEAAHAVAVWIQGGRVVEFSFLPSGSNLGHIRHEFPPDASYSQTLISIAPYAMWATLAGIACVLAVRGMRSLHAAAIAFIWLFIVPLLDIGAAVLGYLSGDFNDLARVLPPPSTSDGELVSLVLVIAALCIYIASYFVHKGLYRDRALSIPAYLLMSLFGLGAMFVANALVIGLGVFGRAL